MHLQLPEIAKKDSQWPVWTYEDYSKYVDKISNGNTDKEKLNGLHFLHDVGSVLYMPRQNQIILKLQW